LSSVITPLLQHCLEEKSIHNLPEGFSSTGAQKRWKAQKHYEVVHSLNRARLVSCDTEQLFDPGGVIMRPRQLNGKSPCRDLQRKADGPCRS
jgi:hypothetical protein